MMSAIMALIKPQQQAIPVGNIPFDQPGPQRQPAQLQPDSIQNQGSVRIIPPANKANAQLVGIHLPPLQEIVGDPTLIDMSKLKRKLLSGENSSGAEGVTRETYWPHMLFSSNYCLNPPSCHSKMTPLHFFSGLTNLIVSDLPPGSCHQETENKLLFMANIANMAHNGDWSQVLDVVRAFFRGLEHCQHSWSSWKEIEDFLVRAERTIRPRLAAPSANHVPSRSNDVASAPKKPRYDDAAGIPHDYAKEQKICFLFNIGVCQEPGDHPVRGGKTILSHICAGCLKRDLGRQPSHGAVSCKRKPFHELF